MSEAGPRPPDATGIAWRGEVSLAWRSYGDGEPALLLLPTWQIIDSRFWKAQVGYLARHHRVVVYDGRGTGASSRPAGAAAYANDECAADVLTVMDDAGLGRAVLVALSCGVTWAVTAAAEHPDRALGVVAIAPACGNLVAEPDRDQHPWDGRADSTDGWAKYNRHYWLEGGFADFRDFFFRRMYSEPHSTKQLEDVLAWSAETPPQLLVEATAGRIGCDGVACAPVEDLCRRVRCPVLVVHGTGDRIRTPAIGARLAELTGGSLVLIEGGGHGPMGRDPVQVNRIVKGFVDGLAPVPRRRTWVRAASRPRRALYLSSPIGLGHARRDLAVATELRKLHPDLTVDWLTQHPVTAMLESEGEHVHPASAWLASESAHIEQEAGEHDLHAFQAIRRMDAILVNNFMVFADLVDDQHYDLVIGDEAWDVDYFLHENPELKRFAFAWMTDFVGWLPMPSGGAAEVALTADYNAEMIEQRARFRRLRDRSIFVGSPEDIVADTFGPGLPAIRDWTRANFDFPGYVTGFDPVGDDERAALRDRFGYAADERLCVVTVGGSGVGVDLLHRVLDAVPVVGRAAPDLRFLVVAGPRIDPASLPRRRGATIVGYLPDLPLHLAVSDLAVVQGGLTTCMELAASRRRFLYLPLRNHFEQNRHVRHRLERYRAGQCLDYELARDPDALAAQMLQELAAPVESLPVETDGAARAAALLGELL